METTHEDQKVDDRNWRSKFKIFSNKKRAFNTNQDLQCDPNSQLEILGSKEEESEWEAALRIAFEDSAPNRALSAIIFITIFILVIAAALKIPRFL